VSSGSRPVDPNPTSEVLDDLEAALGYRFRERELLCVALRHSSYAHENVSVESNERLEFLGDAVIGLVVADLLYEAHRDWSEGDLTRALAALVDRKALSGLAREFGLGDCLALGRTERRSAGSDKSTILADAMEAVIGAIYLDGGLEPVRDLVRGRYASALAPDAPRVERDPKTHLQELVMALRGEFPSYHLVSDSGIEGDERRFEVEVRVQGERWALGTGRSKRRSERDAAQQALPRALEAARAEADARSDADE